MHKLQEYIDVLTKNNLLSSDNTNADDKEIIIKGLTYDSNSVTEGTLFVCKGAAFKQAYLEDAVKKGAVAFISEKEYPDVALPHIIVNDIRRAMPFLGKIFYDSPWNNFKLTGLTGTKGKSIEVIVDSVTFLDPKKDAPAEEPKFDDVPAQSSGNNLDLNDLPDDDLPF